MLRCSDGRSAPVPAAEPAAVPHPAGADRRPPHGYAIIRDVADRTGGNIRLGTGTLYTALARLEALALRRRIAAATRAGQRRRAAAVLPADRHRPGGARRQRPSGSRPSCATHGAKGCDRCPAPSGPAPNDRRFAPDRVGVADLSRRRCCAIRAGCGRAIGDEMCETFADRACRDAARRDVSLSSCSSRESSPTSRSRRSPRAAVTGPRPALPALFVRSHAMSSRCSGHPVRRAHAPASARFHHRRHADARARHRREHGGLHRRQRRAAAAAAVSRARTGSSSCSTVATDGCR